MPFFVGFLKGGGGVQGEGVFLGNLKDSVWEDWGFVTSGYQTTTSKILEELESW